jgi:AraC-like DNA-binding protein
MPRAVKEYHRYLPVSERGRQWGLYVTGAGFEQVRPGQPYPSSGHPATHEFEWRKGRVLHEYALVYIAAGEGQFHSQATGEATVPAGTVMLLFPDVWHRYRPLKETGWEEYWVCFAGEHATQMQERGFLRAEEPLLKTGRDELILRAFRVLLDRMRSEPVGFEQLISASVWEIVSAALSAARRRDSGSRQHELVRRAKLILEEQGEGLPVIEDLAARLGLSSSHLQHLFKEYTGLSPYQYHLQLKVQRAREMLLSSHLSVKQVAGILQFRSVYHFSTLFKKKTGLSPGQWRARSHTAAPPDLPDADGSSPRRTRGGRRGKPR